MSPVETAGLTVFILVLFLGIFLSTLGLPGTVLIVLDVMAYALATGFAEIGLKVILILVAMAIVAELFDFGLDLFGAVRFGMSGRGIGAALICSLAGAIMLTPFFLGLGTLVGIFLGGGAAVIVMETLRRRKLKPAFRAGIGAMLGRIAGITVKGGMSVAMAAFTLLQIYS
ncbi:MAG: hypothetical protein C0394_03920 [Syntrophus sp. (in: bacteria)]|nr:hypothetical protein [Syntrophus sp. (in: bacteria)]